jgi:hypothetical protein
MSKLRTHLSYADAAATLAVFIALGGGAYAATGGFIGSDGTVRLCVGTHRTVSAAKTGRRCPRHTSTVVINQRGPTGAPGASGATGPQGPAGPLLSTLPSGQTETGVYSAVGYVSEKGTSFAASPESFPIALPSEPAVHFLIKGAPGTSPCPGTASAPSALPGNLCVYEGGQVSQGATTIDRTDTQGTEGATRFGFMVLTEPTFSGNYSYGTWGTWAVTAP